jgi:IMP cyclohydrolase
MNIDELAGRNFTGHLQDNPYPGRGLVLGRPSEDTWVMIYWIMGRSTNSRNRRFVADGQVLRTEPVDLSLVADPSLIIYEAMLDLPGVYIVSNGDQTRTIYEALQQGTTLEVALNFTPRISGILSLEGTTMSAVLSIIKASPLDPALSDRFYYRPAMPGTGYGFGLTTYRGDGEPLPSFSGEPLLLPCNGKAEELVERYWAALNPDNRVSLAVKEISAREGRSKLHIRNRF